MQPTSPTPPAHALADVLLAEWEQRPGAAFAAADPATRLRTLAQLVPLCQRLLMTEDANVDVDAGDARTTLADAASFGVATATASGPGRAAQLVAALQFRHHGPAPAGPARRLLFSITSRLDAPLEMDELIFVTETMRASVGEDAEIIFGHGEYDDAAAPGLRVHLLVGYGAPALSSSTTKPCAH